MNRKSAVNAKIVDIEVKISDVIFKIFTILFVGVLGIGISIYNVKISQENSMYKLLSENISQLEVEKINSINKFMEPLYYSNKVAGMSYSDNDLKNKYKSNYYETNKGYNVVVSMLESSFKNKIDIINYFAFGSISIICILFIIYLVIQLPIIFRLYKYKRSLLNMNIRQVKTS